MVPNSILSYYPNYEILDSLVSSQKNCKNINIYIDLKNALQTLYMKDTIVSIVENSSRSKFIDTSIFSSVLSFLKFHKIYSSKRHINIRFYIFLESGQSFYHLNISKKYKIRRKIDNLYGLDRIKRDLFFDVLNKNFTLMEKILNKIPNIHVIRLENLEADFIPYYLISRKLVDTSNDTVHVVYSNDHDLLQVLDDNVYVYTKSMKGKKLISKNEALKHYLKYENVPDEYLPLVMAIMGDNGDDVDGIKGIGPKIIEKNIHQLVDMVGGIDNLYKNVITGNEIFDVNKYESKNKYIDEILQKEKDIKIISNNLKLVSFEIISRYLDDPIKIEMLNKRKFIHEIIENKSTHELNIIKDVLDKLSVYVEDDSLEGLYYNPSF